MGRAGAIGGVLLLMGSLLRSADSVNLFPEGRPYFDTYHEFAHVEKRSRWMHFNTHDPTVWKDGEWYWLYSTDASWGGAHRSGAQKKRSRD